MSPTRFPIIPLLALLLTGCGQPEPKKGPGAPAKPAATVTVQPVEQVSWAAVYQATGTVEARVSTVIAAKVMGYVREIRPQAGDRVREGDLLVTLDSRELEAGIDQARAAAEAARQSRAEVEQALAAAQSRLELAEKSFARMKPLHERKSISDQEFDESEARLKAARADHQMALSRKTQLESRIGQAEAAERAASVTRSYAEIRAPFDAIVTERAAEPGTLAAPGTPLLKLERASAYRLVAPVEESHLRRIRVGHPVQVRFDATGQSFDLRVSEIVPSIDPGSRTFSVRINLPGGAQMRSGLFARASFAIGERPALAIPAEAIRSRGQIESVLVAEQGVARLRMVTSGARREGKAEILSGLAAGDQVIVPVPDGLADGDLVEVRQ